MAKGLTEANWVRIGGLPLFGLLPLFPFATAVGICFWGLFAVLTRCVELRWILPFVVYGLLGGVGQLFTPVTSLPAPPAWIDGSKPTRNEVTSWTAGKVVGNIGGEGLYSSFAVNQHDGFWRVPRILLPKRRAFDEFWWSGLYGIRSGEAITSSFYFRHDGKRFDFKISFFTNTGNHPAKTTVVDIGNGVYRAYATYVPAEDGWVWPPRLQELGGDWTYFDIGFIQLEPGTRASAYVPGGFPETSVWLRAIWWVGTALIGFLVLHGSIFLLGQIQRTHLVGVLTLGLLIHLSIGLVQYFSWKEGVESRIAGLVLHHNFYGHLGVMITGLLGIVGGRLWGALGYLPGLAMVWISGTRGALLGLFVLVLAWWVSLPRQLKIWSAVLGISILLILGLGAWKNLGRFTTIFDPNYSTTQWRIELTQFALLQWREHPITGIGVNRFATIPEVYDRFSAGHPHSLPLALLVEAGLLGCIAFLLLWGAILWHTFRLRLWSTLAVSGVAFLLNLTDYSFFNTVVYIPLWVTVAWGASQNRRYP